MSSFAPSFELPTPSVLAPAVRTRLPTFNQVDWVATTGSTNADLLLRARQMGAAKPWLLGAHLQQTGRGRAGRAWQNRVGAALMFSCAFDIRLAAAQLPTLSPVAGLAACEALRTLTRNADIRVKWPNDVQWRDAKLAGVLAETLRNANGSYTVIIGMGMNLRDAQTLSQTLERPIADWMSVPGNEHVHTAADIVSTVAQTWQTAVDELERGSFSAFVERFSRIDALTGHRINVIDRGKILHHGSAQGVDAWGRLLVHTDTGPIPISVGEISVRTQTL